MTDRRDEEHERRLAREGDEKRWLEERERRSDELRKAWRRNHPSEPEEGGKGGPKKGSK